MNKRITKLLLITLLLFVNTFLAGCSISKNKYFSPEQHSSNKTPKNPPPNSTQRPTTDSASKSTQYLSANMEVFILDNGSVVTFNKDASRLISVKSGHGEIVLTKKYPSRPVMSPDKKKIAYIAPREWEEIGEVFVYDSVTGQNRLLLGKERQQQTTPKVAAWLDNRNLLLIIGPAYGTVTVGGDLYVLDTKSTKLSLIMKHKGSFQEIKDMRINDKGVTLYIANFNKGMTDHTISTMTLTREEMFRKLPVK